MSNTTMIRVQFAALRTIAAEVFTGAQFNDACRAQLFAMGVTFPTPADWLRAANAVCAMCTREPTADDMADMSELLTVDRSLAYTPVGELSVSTVLLSDGEYETMVFRDGDSVAQVAYTTHDAAVAGHARMVDYVSTVVEACASL